MTPQNTASNNGTNGAPEAALTDSQLRQLVWDAPEIVAVLDVDFTIRYVSRHVDKVLGRQPEDVVGSSLSDYLDPRDSERVLSDLVEKSSDPEGTTTTIEFRMRHADGSWRHFEAVAFDRFGDPAMKGAIVYAHDVTRRKSREEDLVRKAFQDPLTGLANRALFLNRVEHALNRIVRTNETATMLFLDLDDFKDINDNYGHAAGDRALVVVAERLRACLRPADTIARLGGDEFGILLENHVAADDIPRFVGRITEALREPFTWNESLVPLNVSIGTASSGPGLQRTEDLLRTADTAMYRAKRGRRSRRASAKWDTKRWPLLQLENTLRRAVERQELGVHYQPAVLLDNRNVVAMEALLRLEDPGRGAIVPAAEAIALAEEKDLSRAIGRLVLREACGQAVAWQEMYPDAPPLMSINVSAGQFRRPDLAKTITEVLQETGLGARMLVLEVAESVLAEDVEHAVSMLRTLSGLGVRLAIDDFGPNYALISDLERFPVDFLKIDPLFVDQLGQQKSNATTLLTSLMVSLARSQGIAAIAEGVETAEQLEELRKMECDLAQGFYFSEPLPGGAAAEVLRASRGAP